MARNSSKLVTGKTYIGIDNGVSGSIGIVPHTGVNARFYHTPIFSCLNYTKEKAFLNRIDTVKLKRILTPYVLKSFPVAFIERPMVNPKRFKASTSALRALEATMIALEDLAIRIVFVDSKEWQKVMLPKGVKGSEELKKASLLIGQRLFPQFSKFYKDDADGILIAEWARKQKL